MRRMKLSSVLEIEFFTYAFPVEILNAWRSKYNLSVRAHWADENEFLIYARYPDDPEDLSEDKYVQHITAEKSLQRYTEMLCVRKWLDCHAMVIDVCNMLYDMKDNFPVKIDLELKEVPEGEGFSLFGENEEETEESEASEEEPTEESSDETKFSLFQNNSGSESENTFKLFKDEDEEEEEKKKTFSLFK